MATNERTLKDHLSLTERVYATLREMILSMELPPGTRLKDIDLAQRLGVSNTPLREAMRLLAADSLVETIPRRGTVVKSLTAEESGLLYEIREALEVLATRLAAARAAPQSLQLIIEVAESHRRAVDLGDLHEYLDLDRRFHSLIAESSQNPILVSMLSMIADRIHIVRRLTSNLEKDVLTGNEHHEIAAALGARDGEAAAALMQQHIRRHGERIRQYLAAGEGKGQKARPRDDNVMKEGREMKHEVGCSTLGWHFFDLETALTGITSLGFPVIDIAMIPGICSHFDPALATVAEKEALKKRVRDAKFRVATLNTFKGYLGESADRETAIGFLRASLRLAHEMGAYGLCIQSGTPRAADDWQRAAEALARDLRVLGDEAAPLGLDIGVEVHREMLISSSTEALKLMAMVDHPRIGITLDPCHIVYGGEDPAAVARKLGPWVRHVHLRDAVGKNTEVVPGEGTVDFPAFVAALDAIGYARPMMIELEYPAPAPAPATICRDAERARNLMKGILMAG